MRVPLVQSQDVERGKRWRRASEWAAALVLTICGARAAPAAKPSAHKAEHQAVQWVALPLDVLGFPGVSETFLRSGSSVLTVHFVDEAHLLVTFGLRALVPRLEGDPGNDEDRLVAAEIVDLPTGKIEARTVWHLHDHGRYLWSLGHGRFLLRMGDRLSSMNLGANLASEEPFRSVQLPGQKYPARAVFVSPDGDLITVESVVSYVNPDGRAAALLGDTNADKPQERTIIQFFRVQGPDDVAGPQTGLRSEGKAEEKAESRSEPGAATRSGPGVEGQAEPGAAIRPEGSSRTRSGLESKAGGEAATSARIVPAGTVMSTQPVVLALDADGYLDAEPKGHNLWAVRFDEFGGKTVEVTKLESTCRPRPQMVSRSEFVAFPCRGSEDSVRLVSYGLDGRETWEESMGDLRAPVFAFAPEAARFAVSHTVSAGSTPSGASGAPVPGEALPRQEVRVYQNASGELLLRVECSPAFKTAENFDLSADGLLAAVVRAGSIAVYKLPPLAKEDREDMEDVANFAPPASLGPVNLNALARRTAASENARGESGAPADLADDHAGTSALPAAPSPNAASPASGNLPDVGRADVSRAAAAVSEAGSASAVVPAGIVPLLANPTASGRTPPTLLKPGEKPAFGRANNEPIENTGETTSSDPSGRPN